MTVNPVELVTIESGAFWMGSEDHYPEERPRVLQQVKTFAIGRTPVTTSQFAAFVADTGYVTTAEQPLDPAQFAGTSDFDPSPGSLVFTPTASAVDLQNWRLWWRWVPGAHWRASQGPGSGTQDQGDHPVVHVSLHDALAYCDWSGTRLPSEPEWEYAARGGLDEATFAWGEEWQPDGRLMANTWQGDFPYENAGARGWRGTSPVGTFDQNGYGLVDVIGNVWEWTSSRWTSSHAVAEKCACSPSSASAEVVYAVKGGSHLCAPEYCQRYRPAARSGQTSDSSTSHLGFRVARSV